MEFSGHPALTVMAIAVAASLLSEIRIASIRVPVVVWLMLMGVAIGPNALAVAKPDALLQWFGPAGLSALFFSAGMELDLEPVKGRPWNSRSPAGCYRCLWRWLQAFYYTYCRSFMPR